MDGAKTYYSKKDVLLGAILWLPLLGPLSYAAYDQHLIAIVILILCAMFAALVWFGTRYTIDSDVLLVQMGPFTLATVQLDKITSIEPTRTFMSAPACSLDRILITYNETDQVLISPKDQIEFMERLMEF